MTIMSGGFGLCGLPENLIIAIKNSGISNLKVISNNAGTEGYGLGLLLETRQIKKAVSSCWKISFLKNNFYLVKLI